VVGNWLTFACVFHLTALNRDAATKFIHFFCKIVPANPYRGLRGKNIMKSQLFLAHFGLPVHTGGVWGFVVLVLLILFLTLVVADGPKDKEK